MFRWNKSLDRVKILFRAGFCFYFVYFGRLVVQSWFFDLLCRWTVWSRRAQFTRQSSVAFINPVYVCLPINKLHSKQLFYKRETLGTCYIWMFPCVPNVKSKWNSAREPVKYTGPLPPVCFTSAWFSWSNPILCQYEGWELWPQTPRAEPDQGERRESCSASGAVAMGLREAAWVSSGCCYPGTRFAWESVARRERVCLWDVKGIMCSESRSMPLLLGTKN